MSCDVAVVGGGLAGFAAGLRAAGCGARVVLVERDPCLGGNATAANVHTLCGLYQAAEVGDALHLHPGLPRRFAEHLREVGAARAPERAGRVWVLPTHPPRLHGVMRALLEGAAGLTLRLGTTLVAAEVDDAGCALELATAGSSERIEAAAVVDASGDAVCAALAGGDVEEACPDQRQLPSLIALVSGVDTAGLEGFGRLRVTHAVAGAARRGTLPESCESLLVRPGEATDEVYLTLNLPRFEDLPYAPLDPENLAAQTERARGLARQVVHFLRSTRPAFAKARLRPGPARIGVRESRRIRGLVTLGRDDILQGRRRDDEVARSGWPIELWEDHRRAAFEHPRGAASIPLGSLVSSSHPRLLAAGRCMAGTHQALGALRVLGTALASGEAAGVAAALAVDRGLRPRDVAPAEIRAYIRERDVPGLPDAGRWEDA